MTRRLRLLGLVLTVASAAAAPEAAAATLEIRAVPPIGGASFEVAGRSFVANRLGVARVDVADGTHALRFVGVRAPRAGMRVRFSRWGDNAFHPTRTIELPRDSSLEIGFDVDYLVGLSFVDRAGKRVDESRVAYVSMRNSYGGRDKYPPRGDRWMIGSRVARRSFGLEPTEIQYSVQSVGVDGANVVNRNQQRFYPVKKQDIELKLLLYSAEVSSSDLLFGFSLGDGIELTYPDGRLERYPFGPGGKVVLPSLARGTYGVQVVTGSGYSPAVPVRMSRDQIVELKVVSYFDLGLGLGLLSGLMVGLLLVRRPALRAKLRPRLPAWGVAILVCAAALGTASPAARAATRPEAKPPTPVLAYYYIWFDTRSWRRAKKDYPLLGRYSSDDERVLRQHVRSAQNAGIDGFIVSWKSTEKLNRRLEMLARIANETGFKLAVIYQGLDFEREPLRIDRIDADLSLFEERFVGRTSPLRRAFDLFDKPLVIWSGTWRFSGEAVARVAAAHRDRMLVLASERNVDGYERLWPFVDGNAYYWSSVNPQTYPGYVEKLEAMSGAIHRRGQIWIAPVAPGFDARMIGGTTTVDRSGGETLRVQLDAAVRSAPDAIGVISWNEFSENTHIEPSVRYGSAPLQTLADALKARPAVEGDFASDEEPAQKISYGMPFLIGLGAVLFAGFAAGFWRREVQRARERGVAAAVAGAAAAGSVVVGDIELHEREGGRNGVAD